jgi:chromosome segregation protein
MDSGERQARESEVSLAKAMAEQARAEAELRVADAALGNARARLERAERDSARLANELSALGDEAELDAQRKTAIAKVETLQAALTKATADIDRLEAERNGKQAARDVAQSDLATVRAELAALVSERSALERAMAKVDGAKAIDRIKVKPGYEHALAAALGEDVNATVGGETGRRWSKIGRHPELVSGSIIPQKPRIATEEWTLKQVQGDGVLRLNECVEAPAELAARLAMIIVADSDDGRMLNPGERLVTRDGRLRRWDGFVAEEDGATAAEQLVRANRLAALENLLPTAEAGVAAQEATLLALNGGISEAQATLREVQTAAQSAEADLRQALRDADRAEDALTRRRNASEALADRMAAADSEITAAKADLGDAEKVRAALPDGAAHDILVDKLTAESEAARQLHLRSQSDLSALDQLLAQQRERRAVAQAEIRGWQDRAGEAERRIADMNKRRAEIASEQEAMTGRPDILTKDIERLEADKAQLADKLAELQVAERSREEALATLEVDLAAAAEAVSTAREQRAGAEARAENQDARRREMAGISGERFECPPPLLPEKHGFLHDEMADASSESARLERLQLDRERIGPVNLIAADELTELETQVEKGQAESEELSLAINRLRGSIGSLNREGRTRLLAAFETVDQHFRRLFATLFNGGQAHLALIDSDDPLEAGLEIFAQPPGKKLQSLTLLSGGEQALTAVALIFGLFLTNPAPICVLDEVDAPLDDANIERFCDLLDAMTKETDTRYLIVTHNAVTMSRMHRLFGVTMVEQGVSRLVSVDLGGAEELLAAE